MPTSNKIVQPYIFSHFSLTCGSDFFFFFLPSIPCQGTVSFKAFPLPKSEVDELILEFPQSLKVLQKECSPCFWLGSFEFLFIFVRAGALLLHELFSSCGEQELLSSCGGQAFHCSGSSCCRTWAPGARASGVVACGL